MRGGDMPRKPDERIEQAKQMFLNGSKLVEIANELGVSENTVRSWKNRYKWNCNATNATLQNNSVANVTIYPTSGAPLGNRNAEKYGFFSKYLPEETQEIFDAINDANPLDLLWHQIQLAYAAIIRAQKLAYVKDQQDKTVERIEYKEGNVIGEKWEVQQAWDKQNNFLKAQARAQSELRSLIKQYDEMLHKNWELATEEQKARIEQLKVSAENARKKVNGEDVDDRVEIINDAPTS